MSGKRKFIPNKYTRFFQKVEPNRFDADQCWYWVGASKGNGYGHAVIDGENITAHRLSYKLFIDKNLDSGLDVCHTCDNRSCVNPDHLFVGTRKENMSDMSLKGRGAGYHRKHLKEAHVQEIRQRLNSGHSPRQIANQTGVAYSTIVNISSGKSYKEEREA